MKQENPAYYSSIDAFSKQSGDASSYINGGPLPNIEPKETYATQKSKSVICTELHDTSPIIGSAVSGSNSGTYHRISSIMSGSSLSSFFQLPNESCEPSEKSWRTFSLSLIVYIVSSVILCVITIHGRTFVYGHSWWALLLLTGSLGIMVTCVIVIARQPRNQIHLLATTPYVPIVPLASFTLNAYLITSLSQAAWLRFAVWLAAGLVIYFGYGIHKSKEKELDDQEVVLYEIPGNESVTENLTTSY